MSDPFEHNEVYKDFDALESVESKSMAVDRLEDLNSQRSITMYSDTKPKEKRKAGRGTSSK